MVRRILRGIRTPLLVLLAAGIVAAALNVAIGPIEAPGLPLPWTNPAEPKEPVFSVWQSSSQLVQGEILGIVVTPGTRQSYASVTGTVTGLPSVSAVSFVPMEGAYRALVPVANSSSARGYQVKIVVTDASGRSAEDTVSFEVKTRSFPIQRLTMPPSQTALLADDKLAQDRAKVSAARANPERLPLWEGAFRQPVQGRITTEYGQLRYVNGVLTSRHTGIDISAPEGAPVAASNSGRVVLTTDLHASGTTVIIDHGLGLFTNYNHLSRILVKEGQMVAAGQIVGEVGSTGFSTGPHLHFTMTVGAVSTNPWVWFAANPKILVTTAGSGGR